MSNTEKQLTIVGIGTSGINIVSQVYQQHEFENSISYLYIDNDQDSLARFDNEDTLLYPNIDSKDLDLLFGSNSNGFIEQIENKIKNTKLLIIVSCLGGDFGTDITPLVARVAKNLSIATIAIVSTPFAYEGTTKSLNAKSCISKLSEYVDSYVVISNDKLSNNFPDMTAIDAFKVLNNISKNCINALTNLFLKNSMVRPSFSELVSFLKATNEVYVGFGDGIGRNKIIRAVNRSLNSKIINKSIRGSNKLILSIVADQSVTSKEVNEIIELYKKKINYNLDIIFNFDVNQNLRNEIRIALVAIEDNLVENENSQEENKLNISQDDLLEIGNTLENELNSYSTGELELPKYSIENEIIDDKDQENYFISSEANEEDDDIPFFLK